MNGSNRLQEFYSPLSKSGYLTPLQRKKLREKRGLEFTSSSLKEHEEVNLKRSNKKIHDRKRKHLVAPKKCSITKVHFGESFLKEPCNIPEKKFFKSSLSSRITNASFSLSFDLKSNFLKCPKKYKSHPDNEKFSDRILKNSNVGCKKMQSSTSDNEKFNSFDSLDTQNSYSRETSVLENENNLEFVWPSDDDLLQRQEKARQQQRKRILTELNAHTKCSVASPNQIYENQSLIKLYPVFQQKQKRKLENFHSAEEENNFQRKRLKTSSKNVIEQLIIDAGQTNIGPKICNTCNMLYNIGQEEDEILHSSYHAMFLNSLRFSGWKEENVVGEYSDGRIIMVKNDEQGYKLKKINDVLLIANKDLGSPDSTLPSKTGLVFLLFISNKKCVAGCLVAEPILSGFKIVLLSAGNTDFNLKNDVWEQGRYGSSSESLPAICGVNRIWVSKQYRRCKLASRMLDCLRSNFIYGHIVDPQEIAFLDPSTDGRKFAASYLKTNNFLVYK